MRTLVLILMGLCAPVFWSTPLSATDTKPVTCHEDQVIVWSADRNTHDICLDIDDPYTQELLTR